MAAASVASPSCLRRPWVIDLIVELLDPAARQFASVQVIHRVLWPTGRKPLSIVYLSTRDGLEGDYDRIHWTYVRSGSISGRSDNILTSAMWFGASQPSVELPRQLFPRVAESGAQAVI